jgi:alkyldihydroxyacetonephosphate synthase
MKRWNGWGEVDVDKQVPPSAQTLLNEWVGAPGPSVTMSLESLCEKVPESRIPNHPLIRKDAETRVKHARGQSLPDWIALRYGTLDHFPDGVAFPTSEAEVRDLMQFAQANGAKLIPYGGGTSVVGHINPTGDAPVLTLSLARLNGLLHLDEISELATFGAGILGPDLEAALRAKGYTLGHFPQSFEYSTLGGWVVTRSSGQQSLGFGRIEDLFAGGRVLMPQDQLDMPPLPASSAGPDLRQLVLGSEGRMGVLTEATVRVTKLPEIERFHAVFFPNWQAASDAVRTIVQQKLPLSMMRLSNPLETETNLVLAGKDKQVARLKQFLRLRKVREGACMLLLGFSGQRTIAKSARNRALQICKRRHGVHVFRPLGDAWRKNRFKAPYLRNHLWDLGYAVDTLETCTTWEKTDETLERIETALRTALEPWQAKVHVFTHLSHFYGSGCSIYTTYVFSLGKDAEDTLARWRALKGAASREITTCGATISHQHGVGADHAPYLAAEKTLAGMDLLRQVVKHCDPDGLMNPGKLLV